MVVPLDMGWQQPPGELKRFLEVLQCFTFHAGERIDYRQEVSGVAETDLGRGIIGLERFFKLALDLGHDLITALNRCKCY